MSKTVTEVPETIRLKLKKRMKVTGKRKKLLPLITEKKFRALAARYGCSKVKKNALCTFTQFLDWILNQMVRQSMLAADYERKKSLRLRHANKAIKRIPEIPNAYLQ